MSCCRERVQVHYEGRHPSAVPEGQSNNEHHLLMIDTHPVDLAHPLRLHKNRKEHYKKTNVHPTLQGGAQEGKIRDHPPLPKEVEETKIRDHLPLPKGVEETKIRDHPPLPKELEEAKIQSHPPLPKGVDKTKVRNHPLLQGRVQKVKIQDHLHQQGGAQLLVEYRPIVNHVVAPRVAQSREVNLEADQEARKKVCIVTN